MDIIMILIVGFMLLLHIGSGVWFYQELKRVRHSLWHEKQQEIRNILDRHKAELQELTDKTVHKMVVAFQNAVDKKPAKTTSVATSGKYRSIDDI